MKKNMLANIKRLQLQLEKLKIDEEIEKLLKRKKELSNLRRFSRLSTTKK